MASSAAAEVVGQPEAGVVLADFRRGPGELFEKCRVFRAFTDALRRSGGFEAQYRVVLEGALDRSVRVRAPGARGVRELLCFDSDSALGLHLDRRVLAAFERVLAVTGCSTPSAPVQSGTHRWLRELEESIGAFYGREDALVFPTGYAANVGAITALVGAGDLVLRDRDSHASIHDGCRYSGARREWVYPHLDLGALDRMLARDAPASPGRLVATDAVFWAHGRIAPLPGLRTLATRHGARLLVDEAHSLGVLGDSGRGLEEHFAMPGAIDVVTGTLETAPGALGGYVTGRRDLVEYLRFFARDSRFGASLPAPICGGVTEALRIIGSEPEHRQRLWANARRLHAALAAASLPVPPTPAPIVPVFVGEERLLRELCRALLERGLRCGSVCSPGVPRGEALLRLMVNARHTEEDIDRAAEILVAVARRLELGRTRSRT